MSQVDLSQFHKFQQADDFNCGPTCLEIIYKAKGINRSIKDILEDLGFDEKGDSTYSPQLCRELLKQNVKNRLILSNSFVVTKQQQKLKRGELINDLKKWLVLNTNHTWFTSALHILFLLQEGGMVERRTYTAKDLKKAIQAGKAVILCSNTADLWEAKKISKQSKFDEIKGETHDGHFVIADKLDRDQVRVIDPYPTNKSGREGVYYVQIDDLINSCLIWASSFIEIKI
jgi:ABC-type bacteriocin/lantibiotic exporter with double-glycine peptidase domain